MGKCYVHLATALNWLVRICGKGKILDVAARVQYQ